MFRKLRLTIVVLAIVMCLVSINGYGHYDPDHPGGHPIQFNDPNLRRAVVDAMNAEIRAYNMANAQAIADGNLAGRPEINYDTVLNAITDDDISIVRAVNQGISDLTGLEHCTGIEELYLGKNQISDLSPISGITGLEILYLGKNQITDISPLAGLINLQKLGLAKNKKLSDISQLAGLTNLQDLKLHKCSIGDISALSGLTMLHTLHLNNQGNPEIRDASVIYETLRNNPWQTIKLEANPLNLASVNRLKALRVQHPMAWIDFNEEGAAAPPLAKGKITTIWATLKAR